MSAKQGAPFTLALLADNAHSADDATVVALESSIFSRPTRGVRIEFLGLSRACVARYNLPQHVWVSSRRDGGHQANPSGPCAHNCAPGRAAVRAPQRLTSDPSPDTAATLAMISAATIRTSFRSPAAPPVSSKSLEFSRLLSPLLCMASDLDPMTLPPITQGLRENDALLECRPLEAFDPVNEPDVFPTA